MKTSVGLTLAILLAFTSGCTTHVTPVINIPELAGRDAAFVDARLGAPAEVIPTNDPGTTPGEFRDYRIPGVSPHLTSHGLMVRFYKGRAVDFMLELPEPTVYPRKALLMAGIDVGNAGQDSVNELVIRWSGAFNGLSFGSVQATRLDGAGSAYTIVQARVQ